MTNLQSMLRSGKAAVLGGVAWLGGALALHGSSPAFFISGVTFAYGLTLAAHCSSRWTLANVVTSVRLALVSWVAGALVGDWSAWLWGTALVALALDGLDGWIARRRGESSDFGARYDMEVDAAFILFLSLLVWREANVGPWVVAIGLMRYGFVLASFAFPPLERPLPPSVARKAVCVVQVLALVIGLNPWLGHAVVPPLLAMALFALVLSFARDVIWCFAQDLEFRRVLGAGRS